MIYEIKEDVNRLSKSVLDAAFFVHTELGPGLFESVYEECLAFKLEQQSIFVEKQKILPVTFEGRKLDMGFRLDLLINKSIIVEIKACDKLQPIHDAQIHTYLKLSGISLGLLLNFNETSLKSGIKRIAMAQNEKKNFV